MRSGISPFFFFKVAIRGNTSSRRAPGRKLSGCLASWDRVAKRFSFGPKISQSHDCPRTGAMSFGRDGLHARSQPTLRGSPPGGAVDGGATSSYLHASRSLAVRSPPPRISITLNSWYWVM